jgi:hypothetical protein
MRDPLCFSVRFTSTASSTSSLTANRTPRI